MALKAKKPEAIVENKPKFMVSGKSGVGKTIFALDFPAPYYIDVEGGATRKQYVEKLVKSGGAYFGKDEGSQDFKTVIAEIKQLMTTKHDYKTLVIDSFSKLYNIAASIAEESGGSDFGKDKKEANKPTRQLIKALDELDMTVILICHGKDKWVRNGKEIVCEGTTFDGYDKMEYELDLWIEIVKTGRVRNFLVKKTRVSTFVEGDFHALNYGTFADLYGKDIIENPSIPVELATTDQIEKLAKLLDAVKVESEQQDKWLKKAGVDKFEDMKSSDVAKVISFLEDKITKLTGGR
jgi:hypothetical protein